MAKVVIIGAGLTGLSVAYTAEQHNFFDYLLIEQEHEPGGLCRSVRSQDFTFDYTGHFFHSTNPSILDMLDRTMGTHAWQQHVRNSCIYSEQTYTPYPYQTNLYGLCPKTIIDCITGFVERPSRANTKNFDTWVLNYFGSGFAQHFFYPYQEKIFDYPVDKLRTGWTGVVPATSLHDILHGALTPRDLHSIGYNAYFLYPRAGGIDAIIKALHSHIKNNIRFQSKVCQIDIKNKFITLESGHEEPYEYLVSTMPLKQLLSIMQDKKNNWAKLSEKLLCNSLVNINIGIKKEINPKKHWIYYPEKEYPFFRIGFPHTIQDNMAPHGCSSLSVEISHLKPINKQQIEQLIETTHGHIKKLFGIHPSDIITEQILTIDHAYVIYDAWHEKNREKIVHELEKHDIYSIGRYGAWKYSGMADAITDGMRTAHTLLKKELI